MGERKKSGGRDFQKGWAGGPGRPKISQEEQEYRAFDRAELRKIVMRYMQMPVRELVETKKNIDLPAIDHFVMKVIGEGINKGDHTRLDALLDRVIGKVKQVVENVGERSVVDSELLDQMHKELVMLIMPKPTEEKPVEESKGLLPGC